MTHLRKIMLEELQRRNYAQTTIDCYLRTVDNPESNFPGKAVVCLLRSSRRSRPTPA